MAYVDPTSSDIKERFSEFDAVSDTRIGFIIAEAKRFVDESWLEDDYAPALRFLVAHMMVMEGLSITDGAPTATSSPITAEKLGDASVSYGSRVAGMTGKDAEYALTTYGVRYMELRDANHPAVLVV